MSDFSKRIDPKLILLSEAPKSSHLAVGAKDGTWKALLPGTVMAIAEVKESTHTLYPLVLTKVSRRQFEFRCGCGQSNCTKAVRFSGSWTGNHPMMHEQQ